MEENIGLHGGEQGEAGDAGGLVEEVGAGDLAVAALEGGLTDNQVDNVHLAHDVLESADSRVRDLFAGGDVAQGRQVLEQVVGELVLRGLQDDALEVLRLNVAITVLVEDVEGLTDALTLQAAQHLGELGVGHVVARLGAAGVQGGPFGVPVKGNAVGTLVHIVHSLDSLPFHATAALEVEQTERNLVLRIGLRKEVLEGSPVGQAELAGSPSVCHSEEDAILLALDFVLE